MPRFTKTETEQAYEQLMKRKPNFERECALPEKTDRKKREKAEWINVINVKIKQQRR